MVKNKTNKDFFWASLIMLLFIIILICLNNNQNKRACFEDNCFKVEVVDNSESRAQGLMFRERLGSDEGMLFVFEKEGIYSFWMKNTLISLDIIWLDKGKRVVYIKENAATCKEKTCESIVPNKKAKYVLEVNAGKANEIGLRVGDILLFKQ